MVNGCLEFSREEASQINRSTVTRVGSLALGLGALAAFIYIVGIGEIEKVLLQVDPAIMILMTAIQLVGFVFYASAWFPLIRATGHKLRFLTCQGISFASIFASYTLPSGIFLEAIRVILGSKESGMKLGESTATVILHRILYIVGFLASTALALLALIISGEIRSLPIIDLAVLPILAIGGLVVLLYLSLQPDRLQPLLDRVLRLAQPLIKLVQKEAHADGKADRFLGDYRHGFRTILSSKKLVTISFLASLGDWGCSVLILWVVLVSLGINVTIWVVIISMGIGKMIQMTPIAVPGMLGIYEAAITTSLSLFGVPVAIAASAALLMRIITFWLDLPVTGLAAYHYGFKLLGKRTLSFRS
jgi:uncharacterized protein (TIRG00374 family)